MRQDEGMSDELLVCEGPSKEPSSDKYRAKWEDLLQSAPPDSVYISK